MSRKRTVAAENRAVSTLSVYQAETNIDDQSPETLPYVLDKLLTGGARDAWLTPIIMKKGRPAVTLSFLADEEKLEALIELVFQETTTIGLRYFPVKRKICPREIKTVVSPWGPARVKIVHLDGRVRSKPEYEDCRRLAEESGEPLTRILTWFAGLGQ
ncbi:MAG: LarC family nickel insertion protein [Candidatus Adiutrix sp.]|jgi:uncharacterized protein (DUF111 family)|nr:LarC family nickel insertion protein [Candidatus Adiutrix sp.]